MQKRILIIEDDLFVKDLYERIFQKHGWTVTTAATGVEGVEKAKIANYDMILLDIMLPEKNGIEVLKEIKAPQFPAKNIPVFLLTNLGQESIIKEAFEIGAEGYLLKAQLLPEQIVKEVENFFEKSAN